MRYYWGLAIGHVYAHAGRSNGANTRQSVADLGSEFDMTESETLSEDNGPGLHESTPNEFSGIDIEGDGEAADEADLDGDDMVYEERSSDSEEEDRDEGGDRDSDGIDEI